MNENDTRHLLAYIQAADRRNVGPADIAFWMETLPAWLDLDTAKAAVRMFFTEPERNAAESVYFTTRHLIRCAKSVRRQRETEEARLRAQRPAIGATYEPPEGGWRARVPGGYPEAAEGAAEECPHGFHPTTCGHCHGEAPAEPHEFTPEERAANRLRLRAMMSPQARADLDAAGGAE